MAGALTSLHGVNIRATLMESIHRPIPIAIANDANCAALAEMYQGNGQGTEDLVLVTLGTGVGCSIILDGQIREGHRYRAGEAGMMIIDLETSGVTSAHDLASTRALVADYAAKLGKVPEEVSGEMLFADTSPWVQQLLQDWIRKVACVVFNLVTTLDPEKLLIGGGVSLNPKLMPLLKQALKEIPYWQEFEVPVAPCSFHNDAGVIGAYQLIRQEIQINASSNQK